MLNSITSVGTFKKCKVPDCAVGESGQGWAVNQLHTLQVTVLPAVYEPQLQREAGPLGWQVQRWV